MPCDSGQGSVPVDWDTWKRAKELEKRCDELTRMLCSLLRTINAGVIELPPDIADWYAKHREYDKSQGRP